MYALVQEFRVFYLLEMMYALVQEFRVFYLLEIDKWRVRIINIIFKM